MKRWLVRILVCLILGAITTAAVAWGCAIRPSNGSGGVSADLEPWWRLRAPSDWSDEYNLGGTERGNFGEFGVELATAHGGQTQNGMMPYAALRVRAGWPMLAMEGSLWYHNLSLVAHDPSWAPEPWIAVPRALPLRPIWPGFAINTLFSAAIWFGVVFGFVSAKRFIRIRRGRCPRCAYDLRGNLDGGCPECGSGRSTD